MPAELKMNPDGASFQAQAVLAMVRRQLIDGIQESWNETEERYMAEPTVSRWENFRHQGYVIMLPSEDRQRRLNVVFYENRSSDDIMLYAFEDVCSLAVPTRDSVPDEVYDNAPHACLGYGKITEAAKWVIERMTNFWKDTAITPAYVHEDTPDMALIEELCWNPARKALVVDVFDAHPINEDSVTPEAVREIFKDIPLRASLSVIARLNIILQRNDTRWCAIRSDNDTNMDEELAIYFDDKDTHFTLQFCGDGVAVNKWVEKEQAMYHPYVGMDMVEVIKILINAKNKGF